MRPGSNYVCNTIRQDLRVYTTVAPFLWWTWWQKHREPRNESTALEKRRDPRQP